MHHKISDQNPLWDRRRTIKAVGTLAIGPVFDRMPSTVSGSEASAVAHEPAPGNSLQREKASSMRIGILSSTFRRPTLEATLDAIKEFGLECFQLGMECAGLPPMPDQINPDLAERIRREASTRGLEIASVQGTFNMCHPDEEQRRAGLRRLRVLASACPRLAVSIIHICTGTRDRDNMWRRHPDNSSAEAWRDMVDCVREAVDIAGQVNVILAFEPEISNVVDSAQKARRLLDEIGEPVLKVTMDAANIFHTGELVRMSEVLDEAFALVGRDIVLAHAKDLSRDGDAGHEAAGHGKLDYDRYLSLLHRNGFHGPLLLHGLNESQVAGCVAFLRERLARTVSTP
jgi:sugar phosphate isomerase/epimerase